MQTYNPNSPWAMLFPTGNLPIAAAGKKIYDLAAGELGVFNEVGISISAAELPVTPCIYFGIGGATINDTKRSQKIYSKTVYTYNAQCYRSGQCKIQELQDVCASCDTTYIFRICYTSRELEAKFGSVPRVCTFPVQTSCCEGCEACPSGNCVELLEKAMNLINESGMFTAQMFAAADKGNLAATPLTPAQIAGLDPKAAGFECPVLRVQGCAEYVARCCSLPGISPDWLDFDLTWENDECCGNVVTLQEACIPIGDGATVCNNNAEAWLYQQPSVTLINANGFPTCIEGCDPKQNYTLLNIGSRTPSSGQLEHWENPYHVTLAIPCADSTTASSVAAILDIFTAPCMLPPQSAIVASCDCGGTPAAKAPATEEKAKTEVASKDAVKQELANQ